MFYLRDNKGEIVDTLLEPTVVYDARYSVVFQFGEKKQMESYFNAIQTTYRQTGFPKIAEDIHLLELPKDQEEIDKVYQICDYIGVLHKKMTDYLDKTKEAVV